MRTISTAVLTRFRPTTTMSTTTTTVDQVAILAAEQQARLEADAFASLYDTVVTYFFSSYGYPRSVAHSVVSEKDVYEACAVAMDSPSHVPPIWVVDDNCTVHEVDRQVRAFLSREDNTYFLYYGAIAIPLIMLAIIFNALAVAAICRIKRRQPRHAIAISLSVSDVILSATTLIKHCDHHVVEDGPLTYPIVRMVLEHHPEINIVWQAAFAMSALGLVCMAADNFAAVAAPFSYGTFSSSSWIAAVLPTLWGIVLAIMTGLRFANLNHSSIVQHVVAAIICTLLFVILSAYGFTCFQALLYRRRTDQWAQPKQKISMRRRLLKGFFTTTLLVLTCLLSWGPLVCYLLVDVEVLKAARPVFLKFLLFCLVMFHLGAVLNPIIYSMRMRGIRISLFKMLKISNQTSAMLTGNMSTTVGHSNVYKSQQSRNNNNNNNHNNQQDTYPSSAGTIRSQNFNKSRGLENGNNHNQNALKSNGVSTDSQLDLEVSTPMLESRHNQNNDHEPVAKTQSKCVDESVGPDVAMDPSAPFLALDTSRNYLQPALRQPARGRWSPDPSSKATQEDAENEDDVKQLPSKALNRNNLLLISSIKNNAGPKKVAMHRFSLPT